MSANDWASEARISHARQGGAHEVEIVDNH
jgi:hypothetical protein